MNKKEALNKRIKEFPEVPADIIDKAMIADAQAINDGTVVSLESFKSEADFSGKLNIRIPKSLHFRLSNEARKDGVSLNQYIIYKLAR